VSAPLPFVTVYTITYRQPARVVATVRSLLDQDYPHDSFEVVVLDDGSDDETGERLADAMHTHPVTTVLVGCRHERHYMSASRWNRCVAAADPRASVLVQVDDVIARPDLLRRHAAWHADGRLRVVTGAKFEGPDPTYDLATCVRSALSIDGGARRGVPASAIWGASLSLPAAACRAMGADGPYDESMEGWGFHEVELALRLEQAGAELVYDPACGVLHRDHGDEEEAYRGIDRTTEVAEGAQRGLAHVLRKHRLTDLPRW
jgi:glycosyltransferase involved in cell wall biosynthesis